MGEFAAIVGEAYDLACTRWPGIAYSPEAFSRDIASLDLQEPVAERLAELYLVRACLAKDAAATEHFEHTFLRSLVGTIVRDEPQQQHAQEVLEQLRVALLFGAEDGQPKLLGYGGRGSLAGWLRVVASRVSKNHRRGRRRAEVRDVAFSRPMREEQQRPTGFAELDLLRAQYAPLFHEAFTQALEGLDARSRTMLRMSLLDGTSIEGIGTVFGVHRATVHRWLSDTREALLTRTRELMAAKLGRDHNDLESVFQLVGSAMDGSVRRVLSETPTEALDAKPGATQ